MSPGTSSSPSSLSTLAYILRLVRWICAEEATWPSSRACSGDNFVGFGEGEVEVEFDGDDGDGIDEVRVAGTGGVVDKNFLNILIVSNGGAEKL